MTDRLDEEYLLIVSEITENEEFVKLKDYYHHNSCIYSHSLSVSYLSYKVAKTLRFDYRAVARGGLLHDFFLYDWREYKKDRSNKNHGLEHPKTALNNSKKHFNLSKKEEDIILKHMWPKVLGMPRYKESMLVSMVDKYCAVKEFSGHFKAIFSKKLKKVPQAS